jgi:FkbM family methyltransferase
MSALRVFKFIASHPLNSDRKLSAFVRYAKWQIGSRLVPGAVSFDWISGAKIFVRPGDKGLTANIYAGLEDFCDMAFVLHVLRKDDLFIDVGANLGSYTILACAAFGARGYAFEPVPATFEKLVQNVRLNNIEGRVQCCNVGIGRERGALDFTSDLDTTNHAMAPGEVSGAAISVPVTALDDVLADQAPTLMKIDVEGFEARVLEGAVNTLKKDTLNAVIIELNGSGSRYGFDESEIVRSMLHSGFKAYSYHPMERTLSSLDGKNKSSGNTLFVRNESAVMERLRTAPKVFVNGRCF